MRGKLIELIVESVNGCARHWAEIIADHLIENGVEPVMHGHWILQEDNKHSCCSSCNFKRNISTQYGWDYCPHCGAKMDGKEEEE